MAKKKAKAKKKGRKKKLTAKQKEMAALFKIRNACAKAAGVVPFKKWTAAQKKAVDKCAAKKVARKKK